MDREGRSTDESTPSRKTSVSDRFCPRPSELEPERVAADADPPEAKAGRDAEEALVEAGANTPEAWLGAEEPEVEPVASADTGSPETRPEANEELVRPEVLVPSPLRKTSVRLFVGVSPNSMQFPSKREKG